MWRAAEIFGGKGSWSFHPPEGGAKSERFEQRFRLGCRFWAPAGREAIAVPAGRQAPALRQSQRGTARDFPVAAPAIDVLFRPEEEHRFSGENEIFVPAPCGNGEVNNAASFRDAAAFNTQGDGGIATGAGSGNDSVAAKHSRDAQSVPDATAPPGVFAGTDMKRSRYGPKGRGTKNLGGAFLQNDDVSVGEAAKGCADLFVGEGQRRRQLMDFGYVAVAEDEAIEREAKSGVVVFGVHLKSSKR